MHAEPSLNEPADLPEEDGLNDNEYKRALDYKNEGLFAATVAWANDVMRPQVLIEKIHKKIYRYHSMILMYACNLYGMV
jgi:hypothetical protein